LPSIRRCKNKRCEYNIEGAYCEAVEIVIDEFGECEAFEYKQEETEDVYNTCV
jgi:hypothetical protein